MASKTNWAEYMANPKSVALKQFIYKLITHKYSEKTDDLLTRLSTVLITESDMMSLHELISSVYEIGYRTAVDDYREQLKKLNIRVDITTKNPATGQ